MPQNFEADPRLVELLTKVYRVPPMEAERIAWEQSARRDPAMNAHLASRETELAKLRMNAATKRADEAVAGFNRYAQNQDNFRLPGPIQAVGEAGLELIKPAQLKGMPQRVEDSHERTSATQMLKEYVMAQDKLRAEEAAKHEAWKATYSSPEANGYVGAGRKPSLQDLAWVDQNAIQIGPSQAPAPPGPAPSGPVQPHRNFNFR